MVGTSRTKLLAALTVTVLALCAGSGAALAEPFSAALLPCASVTLPAETYRLRRPSRYAVDGSTSLDDVGTFTLSVTGAMTNEPLYRYLRGD